MNEDSYRGPASIITKINLKILMENKILKKLFNNIEIDWFINIPPTVQNSPNNFSDATRSPLSNLVTCVSKFWLVTLEKLVCETLSFNFSVSGGKS